MIVKSKFRVIEILVCMVLTAFAILCIGGNEAYGATELASGSCGAEGSDLTWTMSSAGVLTISGSGDMEKYDLPGEGGLSAPWSAFKNSIYTVTVEEGVTSIGDYAFYSYENLIVVELPASLTKIGSSAFEWCTKIVVVNIEDLANW